jgi:thiamine monophosphate synthase
MSEVLSAGGDSVAMISEILAIPQDIAKTVRDLLTKLADQPS